MLRLTSLLKYLLLLFCSCLLAWLLPLTYKFLTEGEALPQFVIYSSLQGDFLLQKHEGDSVYYEDRQGNSFTQFEADSLLPTLNYPMLMMEGRMPDSVLGKEVSADILQNANFFFSHAPDEVNQVKPALYPLLESQPPRIVLAYPNDIFRLVKDGIEFLKMNENVLDTAKSELYTQCMLDAGVSFPIVTIGGNPTPMKDYDEGYVFTDQNKALFQLKMVKGKPWVKRLSEPLTEALSHIFVTEYPDKRFLAFLLDVKGQLFALEQGSYKITAIGLPNFNPVTDDLIILGNLFDWNVELDRDGIRYMYAIDNENLSRLSELIIQPEEDLYMKIGHYLFPFELSFESELDKFFRPHCSAYSFKALAVNVFVLILFLMLYRFRSRSRKFWSKDLIIPSLLLFIFGLYTLLPALIFTKRS